MKVLNHIPGPTFFSHLSRSYPAQSLASTGFYRAYNSYPSSTIICNSNQIFSNSFTQYNQIPPSIHYSHLPITTNSIPANYYSCQSLPVNYSVPSLSYPRRYNSVSSIGYYSLPTRITYSSATYQSLNPPIPPIFYAPQSSNLSHKFVSSNLSNFNVSSYRSNQVALDSNPPIEFTDNFFMPIKNAHGSSNNLNLKQIANLVPIGFTGGILEPEIDPRDYKLKICNSVSLSEIQSKIWIRNGDNLVELPNHLLEKKLQISEQNLHSSPMITPQIYEQNLYSSPMITPQTITSETSFLGKHSMPFPKMMSAFSKLNQSLIKVKKLTTLEEEILQANFGREYLSTSTQDKELTSISDSTTPSSPLSLSLSPSQSPPSTTINPKLEIMTLDEKMVDGEDLKGYELGSKFIVRLTGKPELSVRAILC